MKTNQAQRRKRLFRLSPGRLLFLTGAAPIVAWLALELGLSILLHSKAYAAHGVNYELHRQSAIGMWMDGSPGACLRGPHARLRVGGQTKHWSFKQMKWVA